MNVISTMSAKKCCIYMFLLVSVVIITVLFTSYLVTHQRVATYKGTNDIVQANSLITSYQSNNTYHKQTCGKRNDLSDDHSFVPLDMRTTILDEMRSCGLQPRLLSRAVLRDNDDGFVVTNIVHYIFFTDFKNTTNFQFQHYLSFRSTHRFLQPRYIFLHGDKAPNGEWWQRTLKDVDNLYYVYTVKPKTIYGKPIKYVQHAADIQRLTLLIGFGGIYLDTDMLILKSLDPLRRHELVLARELSITISNGIILARRGALFLRMWLENYRNYIGSKWAHNSVLFANRLQKLYPHLVRVEPKNLLGPIFTKLEDLYGDSKTFFNWSTSYSIHIYHKQNYRIPKTPEELKGFNSTLGQVMRYIYFGSAELLPITGKRFIANT